MSILSSLKTYLQNYSELKENAPVWADFVGEDPTQYSIVPIPGSKVIEYYLDGSSLRSFTFAFQSTEYTADELERLETNEFFEAFAEWMETQTENGSLPTLASGKEAEEIRALGWHYLYQQGNSSTGIYQVQCELIYHQDAIS